MGWIDEIVPEYATITGQYVAISHDTDDENLTPDVQPLEGTITLRPTVDAGRIDDVVAQILTINVRVLGGQIVDDQQSPGIRILATDSDIGVEDWAWTASFLFDGGLQLHPVTFKAPAGATVNLTSGIIPTPSAPYQIVQGTPGQDGQDGIDGRGIQSISGNTAGVVTVTYTDGSTSAFTIDGYVTTASLDGLRSAYLAARGA